MGMQKIDIQATLQKANFEYYNREIESVKLEAYLHHYLDKLNRDIKAVSKLGNLSKEQKSKLLFLIRRKRTQMKKLMKEIIAAKEKRRL